jgi:uncharacterized membrane protein YbaN (DUF454 family)
MKSLLIRKRLTSAMSNPLVRHTLRVGAGVLLLILGVLGLFLPGLQGILFLLVATWLLSPYVPFFARLRAWMVRRFPRAAHYAEHMRLRMKQRWGHKL